MHNRSLSRELSLISLGLIKDKVDFKLNKFQIEEIFEAALDSLINHCREELDNCELELENASQKILDSELQEGVDSSYSNVRDELKKSLTKIETVMNTLSVTLDFPKLIVSSGQTDIREDVNQRICNIVNNLKSIDSDIDQAINKLKNMFPSLIFIVAHGQMNETELENAMISFNNGEVDLMICTTIIESGLDIPKVNTIIIEDSHKFGLSQLYQLRGRVGRSGVQAHAWLFYPNINKINDIIKTTTVINASKLLLITAIKFIRNLFNSIYPKTIFQKSLLEIIFFQKLFKNGFFLEYP